jgi:NAD+ synthase
VLGETGYIDGLRDGNGGPLRGGLLRQWFQKISRKARASGYVKHRYRRELAEAEAERRHLQLIGAGNRSEWLTGYFTPDGIDDVEIQPIGGLYKTQVRQLAAALDVPEAVQAQAPSPDGAKGITDELDMGISYRKIDLVLDHFAGGLSRETIESAGCTDADIALVRQMKDLSAWQRGAREDAFAVDGGPHGGLRTTQIVTAT